MGYFKWLHLSDLHFRICEGFDMCLILDRLKKVLQKETENDKFQYIFLTGDLADRNDYSIIDNRINELLLDSNILEADGKIFWVCGNHDIPRTYNIRKDQIVRIRDKNEINYTFERAFADEECRGLLLGAFKGYNAKTEQLFGSKYEDEYPHQVIHTDRAEIVLLNTCITSCDDEDEHRLYLCESRLIKLFNEIEVGKPVFVLGHHSLNFLADSDRGKLISLFQEKNVSVYLCGHSHQLGVQPLYDSTLEVVSGGFKIDSHAIISFIIGSFDEDRMEYSLIPYTYRFGSKIWAEDYNQVRGIEKGKQYSVPMIRKGSAEELSDLINRCQSLFQGVVDFDKLKVDRFNQIGERVLYKYIQTLSGVDVKEQLSFDAMCEIAAQNGSKRINYISLRMTETLKDIWRFRENLTRILYELKLDNISFPTIQEKVFDFNYFYEIVNEFDVTENAYILIVDAIHDIDHEKRKMLAEFQWDIVLDYDGFSNNGGLRSCAARPNIKDWRGDYRVISESILRRGSTSWVQIGEQMKFTLNENDSGLNLREIKDIFGELVQKLYENTNGTANFIFLKNIEVWDKELMRIVWDRFGEKARFVIAGAYNTQKLDKQFHALFLNGRGETVTSCYEILQTSGIQFFNKFSEYSETSLEKTTYKNGQFPSINGREKLDQNLYVNLEDFFEVLTSDIGFNLKYENKELEDFYLGGEAAWSLFYTKEILDVLDEDEISDLVNRIKTVLGAKQERPQDAVFYLLHKAGFGGTTAAKGIAWKMHLEHPTLILKNYEYGKIKPLIQNLYDNHSRKGILVIADENRFSISELESLQREMGLLDRPFALLIIRRSIGKIDAPSKRTKCLTQIKPNIIKSLASRFERQSHLDKKIKEKKKEQFDEIFTRNRDMRCPFLIGLYYQDEQFNGVSGYVERIMRGVDSESELKLLFILSIINYYGRIGVIKEIVKKYVSLPVNSDYLEKYPYAKDAFIATYDNTLSIKVYREKHFLISRELMKQCSQKLFKSDYQQNLKDISIELIEKILEINNDGISQYYKNLIERLFIYKNPTDMDENGYMNLMEFSPLVMALPSQVSKEEVMRTLAENVKETVKQISAEKNELYYKMAAHICGHLGRLYKASPSSSKLMENGDMSVEWCEAAEEIMRKGRFEDAYIYHMHGTSLSKQCHDTIQLWKNNIDNCSIDIFKKLEKNMQKALEKFDQTVEAGEFVRGSISKLSLLIEYMQFLMVWKKIESSDEISKLTAREREYIQDIDDLISLLEETVLDPKDEKRLLSLKNSYKAEIMFNNFGKAVEYYTNTIKNIITEKGEDAEELYVLRSGLVGAILGKYHQEGKNPYVDMLSKDVERILEALEKNIFSTTMLSDQWERQRRCNDCHRWLRVAKLSSTAVQTGINVAEKWRDLQNEMVMRDPRPYYYLAVLHYLNTLDGYSNSLGIAQVNHKEAYRIAENNSGLRIIKIEKIRDILLDGKGMNRIKSVVNLPEIVERDGEKAIKLRGKFQTIDSDKNKKIGIIKAIFPQELKDTNIYFKMGDGNTISVNQSTHLLEFGMGFTFERLEAINSTVKDISSRQES